MATKILSFATKALRRREAVARFAHSAAAPLSRASQLTELGNGVRVVSEDLGGQTVTIGVSIDCGSRYESEDTAGVSSLVVHSLLSQSDEKALNAMGAELKARVGRDRLFLALRCLSRDVTKGIEILGQLVANPDFANVESARDRAFREMASVDANPEAVVMNGLHAMAFQNTGLALPPVGRSESLARLSRKDCENYVNLHFKGPRVVVAVAGDVDHDLCVKTVDKSLAKVNAFYDKSEIPALSRSRYTGSDLRVRDDAMPLAHIAIAVEGAPRDSSDSLALSLAATLFGRWDPSFGGGADSSSYMGLCSAADALTQGFRAFNISFADSGLFGAYFATERLKQEDLLWHATYEWKRFCTELTDNELRRAKNAFFTQLLRREETSEGVADVAGEHVLAFGRRVPLDEWRERVLGLSAARVRDVCNEHVWDRCPVVSAFGPIEQLEDYEIVRSKFYWFRY